MTKALNSINDQEEAMIWSWGKKKIASNTEHFKIVEFYHAVKLKFLFNNNKIKKKKKPQKTTFRSSAGINCY